MNGKRSAVGALVVITASVLALGGASLTAGTATAQSSGHTTARSAPEPTPTSSRPAREPGGVSALSVSGAVPAFSAVTVTIRTCPSNSCGAVQTIPQSIWLWDLCWATAVDGSGAEWDLVYRPNGKRAGFVPANTIYGQNGQPLTGQSCD